MPTYKFDKGYSSRGAQMGRAEYNNPPKGANTIRLFRVGLDGGGYDNGGAYWGLGGTLWCAMADTDETGQEQYIAFTRAGDRRAAMVELGLTAAQLISKKGVKS